MSGTDEDAAVLGVRADARRVLDDHHTIEELCAAGMAIDGEPSVAAALFSRAWEARRDDYDASIAAHFQARHQSSGVETLRWNQLAVAHAEAVTDDRARPLFASLYLNLGDSYRALGRVREGLIAVEQGLAALGWLPAGGYHDFVEYGLQRLHDDLSRAERCTATSDVR